ncbi:MAG: citrate transporter [Candidatus Nitrosopolaris wilkensis]|nr:MAG: citrate transporter [Candidatus Nitrosopolaris wilkensis]
MFCKVSQQYIAIAIFAAVYALIIIGRTRRYRIPIWVSMLIGAFLMIVFQVIGLEAAFKSINLDVIGFLFGMFSIVTALDKSGVLRLVAIKMLSRANSPDSLLLIFVVGMGILSAFLVNDTIALLGIPLIVYISKQVGIRPLVLLIALAFGISVGSTMTPIGNPQNLLIAIQSGISLPFITFVVHLTIPTLFNLFSTYFILRMYFKKDLVLLNGTRYREISHDSHTIAATPLNHEAISPIIENPRLAKISSAILLITIAGFIISEFLHFLHIASVGLSVIALLDAGALYLVSGSDRKDILRRVDYSVLVFFAAMFVVTSALWSSGAISMIMSHIPSPNPNNIFQSNAVISAVSILLSQILSNVPFVALYNFVMLNNGFGGDAHVSQWMMLASASTIAGNLTILGAASNIIIIDVAESKNLKAFTFVEFLKIGTLVTLTNIGIYYLFITYL